MKNIQNDSAFIFQTTRSTFYPKKNDNPNENLAHTSFLVRSVMPSEANCDKLRLPTELTDGVLSFAISKCTEAFEQTFLFCGKNGTMN